MTELSVLLQELRAELQIRNNPGRTAYAKLNPNRYGWPDNLYSEAAFHIWEGVLRKYPNDWQTIHHLAIMYHARAFDLELSLDPGQADDDWRRAMDLWHRLWSEDTFWQELANQLDSYSSNPFPEIRTAWPEYLLQIHFDIAFDKSTKNFRSRQHIRLALHAPFPEEIKHKVRTRAYEQTINHLSAVVWEPTTFDSHALDPALTTVGAYLDKDETFLPALTDLLGLLTKFQTSSVQKTNAAVDTDERQACLVQTRLFSEQYNPYIAKLDRDIEQLEPDILSNLYLWHWRTGQALCLLNDFEKAASSYYFAWRAAKQDGDNERQREMEEERSYCLALAARENALKGDNVGKAKARKLLGSLQDADKLSGRCLHICSNTFMLLDELDMAKQQCQMALTRLQQDQRSIINRVTVEMANHLLPEVRRLAMIIENRLSIRDSLIKVQEAMAANQWQTALTLLEQAAKLQPDHPTIHLLQSQCYKEQIKFNETRQNWQGTLNNLFNNSEE